LKSKEAAKRARLNITVQKDQLKPLGTLALSNITAQKILLSQCSVQAVRSQAKNLSTVLRISCRAQQIATIALSGSTARKVKLPANVPQVTSARLVQIPQLHMAMKVRGMRSIAALSSPRLSMKAKTIQVTHNHAHEAIGARITRLRRLHAYPARTTQILVHSPRVPACRARRVANARSMPLSFQKPAQRGNIASPTVRTSWLTSSHVRSPLTAMLPVALI